jgi:CBS domain containing-hemolysin-like protein
MTVWLTLAASIALFVLGVRLSAFFSGSETGFYRVSFLRLSIDAHAGDSAARRLLWFVQNPSYFVATTLVGNNIANYLATVAIGFAVGALFTTSSVLLEVATTLLFAPVIFLFGELMPKNLYFRAPTGLLRQGLGKFWICYLAFLPVSLPLVWITRLFERLSKSGPHQLDLVLGRHRLSHVLDKGHEHGLLTAGQGDLVHGLLHESSLRAADIMTPADRILGLEETATREDLAEFAEEYGLTHVAIRRAETTGEWFGYVRLIDLKLLPDNSDGLVREMPRISHDATRLTALLALRENGHALAAVCDGDSVVGTMSEKALIEHFMHPAGAQRARKMSAEAAM